MSMLKAHMLSLAAAAVMFTSGAAIAADGPLFRHAADFFKFDGSEFATTVTANPNPAIADGALFYVRGFKPAANANVVYVTLFATGDEHGGAGLWLSCRWIAGGVISKCRNDPAGGIDGAPSGWIGVHKVPSVVGTTNNNCNDGGGGPGDCHDNVIAYSWCVRLPSPTPATVQVRLKMATSLAGQTVFIEKGHVYIDSSFIEQAGKCLPVPPPTGTATGGAKDVTAATTRRQSK